MTSSGGGNTSPGYGIKDHVLKTIAELKEKGVDIREVCSDGKELTQDNAYRNASVSLVNAFFSIAEANGFTSNYSYGNRFIHSGNTNHFMHDDHFHIGLPGILAFFNNRSTNAHAESLNAQIKLFRANLRGVSNTKLFLYRLQKVFA